MPDEVTSSPKEPVIQDELAEELASYKGKWVAVDGGRVVAAGASAEEVVRLALAQHVTDPLVFRVPMHPERVTLL